MATRDAFSAEELGQHRGFPEITRAELIRYFTPTVADEAFVRKFRFGCEVAVRGGLGDAGLGRDLAQRLTLGLEEPGVFDLVGGAGYRVTDLAAGGLVKGRVSGRPDLDVAQRLLNGYDRDTPGGGRSGLTW